MDPDPIREDDRVIIRDTTPVAARRVDDEGRPITTEVEPPVAEKRFSIGATFLGWAVASFFTFVFVAILAGILGTAALGAEDPAAEGMLSSLAIGGLIGYLIVAFLAYLIGGYAAGRIALWDGVKHGLLTVAWAVLFAILGVIVGASVGTNVNIATNLGLQFDAGNLTGAGILALVLSLAAMLGGAALGGAIGERYHQRVHGELPARRRTLGGRPL